jgi:hypothetical protein
MLPIPVKFETCPLCDRAGYFFITVKVYDNSPKGYHFERLCGECAFDVVKAKHADDIDLDDSKFYQYHYILDDKHMKDTRPVSGLCDCHLCKNYSRAYLRHLHKVGDSLGYRLATMHNLRFYTMLMEKLRASQNGA